MEKFLASLPYSTLIMVAIIMLLAPFFPMPHVVEKIIMLKKGELKKAIDIFDLFFHLTPVMILILKLVVDLKNR